MHGTVRILPDAFPDSGAIRRVFARTGVRRVSRDGRDTRGTRDDAHVPSVNRLRVARGGQYP